MQVFDPKSPPRAGRHLIEASAGTGKTYTIMSLVVQAIVIDGLPPDALMLTTFTRASTRELRARVRSRLTDELHQINHSDSALLRAMDPDLDPVVARHRITSALADLQSIAIYTIHSFANQVITELGPLVGIHPTPSVDDLGRIRDAVARDTYRWLFDNFDPNWVRRCLGSMATFATELGWLHNHRHATLQPRPQCIMDLDADREERQVRVDAIRLRRDEFAEIAGRNRMLYQHLDHYEEACLRATDPSRTAKSYLKDKQKTFPHLPWDAYFALGQPTQAEAQFKAAALELFFNQLQSRLLTQQIRHPDALIDDALEIANRVSDEALAQSRFNDHQLIAVDEFQDTDRSQWTLLDRLYPDQPGRRMILIGDPKQTIYRFRGADTSQYTRIRDALPQGHLWTLTTVFRSAETVVEGLNALYLDRALFGSGIAMPRLTTGAAAKTPALQLDGQPLPGFQWLKDGQPETVARTVAQLIGLGQQGRLLYWDPESTAWEPCKAQHLCILTRDRTVALQIKQAGHAYGIPMIYSDPETVFKRPIVQDLGSLIAAIATPLRPGTITELLATRWMNLSFNTQPLTERLEFRSVQEACLSAYTLWFQQGPARAIQSVIDRLGLTPPGDGLSCLTQHTDLLHALEYFGQHGKGLTPHEAVRWWHLQRSRDDRDPQTTPRTPTDQSLVLINTMHGAKGLEYPIVLIAGELKLKQKAASHYAIDYVDSDGPVLDFALSQESHKARDHEQHRELHRLAYVALTRAKYAVFVGQSSEGALGDLWTHVSAHQPSDHHCHAHLPDVQPIALDASEPSEHRALARPIEPRWLQTSFSQLSQRSSQEHVPSRAQDEPDESTWVVESPPIIDGNQGWHAIPGGIVTGNLLHELLEDRLRFRRSASEQGRWLRAHWPSTLSSDYQSPILSWAEAVLQHRIGSECLAELAPIDCRPEPGFRLTLKGSLHIDTIRHGLQQIPWMHALDFGPNRSLAMQLTGFIDLVFYRDGQYHLLDYKTNRLGDQDAAYTEAAVEVSMQEGQYTAQAALYALALHHWLALRLPNYDPIRHLGEIHYLFCRGLNGPSRGLWSQPIPVQQIQQLSEEWIDVGSR
jgi:exodeoxyribonuclease V beta subunit